MRIFLVTLTMCCFVPMLHAGVASPYVVDADTLHLYHFDGDGLDAVTTDAIDLTLDAGAAADAGSAAGFGTSVDMFDGISGGGPTAAATDNPVSLSDFVGANGAFTFEAIIRPDIALGSQLTHMQIISMDGDYTNDRRGWHFRISNGDTLQFTRIGTSVEDFQVDVPTTGIHAYAVGDWYHVAVTYNGNEGTADNLKLYWTKLNSGVSESQLLDSFQMGGDLNSAVVSSFGIGNEMRPTGGGYTENFEGLIDEVRISSIARAAGTMIVATSAPTNPNPKNGAINVSEATSQLSWEISTDPNVTVQYLYMVEGDPNFVDVTPITVTDLIDPIEVAVPLTLAKDKSYYWRVDSGVDGSSATDPNTITGPVWMFETAKSTPVITQQPQDTAAFVGDSASFQVAVTSASAEVYAWYQSDDDVISVETDTEVGSNSSTYSIGSVAGDDEKYYYCQITNDATEPTGSEPPTYTNVVSLTVKRVVAHYPFDGNANDVVGDVDGTLKNVNPGDPIPGYDNEGPDNLGQAIDLDGTQYVELSTAARPNNSLGGGLTAGTIAVWVRLDSLSAVSMLMGTHNDVVPDVGNGSACQVWLSGTGDEFNCRLRQDAGDVVFPTGTASASIADGLWHLVAVTFEAGGVGQLYLDGMPLGGASGYAVSPLFSAWEYPMLIGGNNDRGAAKDFLDGAIGDIKIYNYARTGTQIVDDYRVVYPTAWACINAYAAEYDFDGNCIVDMADFAEIASAWLSCGRYPDCN